MVDGEHHAVWLLLWKR